MYYLGLNNEKAGPFTLQQVRQMWRAGTVAPQTLFWEEGMADWQPLDRIAAARLATDVTRLKPAPPTPHPADSDERFSPDARAYEPSAYDRPAAAPPGALPPVPLLPAPAYAPPPDGPNSLIAPTRLPPGSAGTLTPAAPFFGSPDASADVPTTAYWSLGLGLSWPVLLLAHGIGFFVAGGSALAAVVAGHMARAAIRRSGNRRPGLGIATAGLAFGYAGLALLGLLLALLFLGIVMMIVMFVFMLFAGHH